jgi:anti-sigma B factor antagonist
MDVKSIQQGEVLVYQIQGEINISTSPELKKQFDKQAAKKTVVDLSKVTYIDSSGLATLVEMLKKTKGQGGSLGLAGMSEKVRSLFEITKLDKLFSIFPTSEQAVSAAK